MNALDVQVGIFGQNEAKRIEACIRSVSAALGTRTALITLLLNGSSDDSEAISRAVRGHIAHELRIYVIPHADKANAMNLFFHQLRVPASLYVCVDAYVTIDGKSIDGIERRFAECPDANVVTGIAANGRSEPKSNAATVSKGGIIHGQLYALRPSFLDRLCARDIHLPVGLYRGDGLIGYLACTDLDAVDQPWLDRRLVGAPEALFTIDRLSPFRWRDIRRQFRRKIRQQRGRIENKAIRTIAERRGFEALPPFADDMIRDHLRAASVPPTSVGDWPFMVLAIQHHRATRHPEPARLDPLLRP